MFWKWNWALYFYLFAYLIGVTWSTILYHLALSNQLGTSILNCAWNMKSEWTDMKCLPNKGALHSVQMSTSWDPHIAPFSQSKLPPQTIDRLSLHPALGAEITQEKYDYKNQTHFLILCKNLNDIKSRLGPPPGK